MYHLGQLVGQDLLGAVQLAALPLIHFVNLLQRQEGKHANALENIAVANIAPILVEIEGAGLIGIKPNGVAGSFSHLVAL